MKKENDERKADNAYKFAMGIHHNLDDYHERKNSFYEKIVNSYATNRYKYNKLGYHNNPQLEKHAFGKLFQDTCPGLKPSSNWPVSLDDLLNRLTSAQLDELFHQPFDLSGDFHTEAMTFVNKYFGFLSNSELSVDEKIIFEEYLIKSIQALLIVKIIEGNFGRLFEVLESLNTLRKKNKDLMDDVIRKVVKKDINNTESTFNHALFKKIKDLLVLIEENDNKLYPLMRNYSINEYFSIDKSILFAPSKSTFSNSCSIATDSKFLYIILSGVNGGMLKVGTGNQETIRGKVYLTEKLDSFGEDFIFSWVYVKNKLYMKTVSVSFNTKSEFGYLFIINPDTFKTEGKIKLLFPEITKHPAIQKKNENFVLLTDGDSINVLILEPVLKEIYENKEKKDPDYSEEDEVTLQPDDVYKQQSLSLAKNPYNKSSKQKFQTEPQIPADIYTFVNMMLYTFPVNTISSSLKNTSNLSSIEKEAIEEIYEAFTHLFTREECRKALILNNWSVSKTAVYLVENEKEIKQPVLIPEKVTLLFQTKIEATYCKNLRTEFKIVKNSPFDTTQYDLLKWTLTDNMVIGYKLKEGACVLFSSKPSDLKEFSFRYTEKSLVNDAIGKEGLVGYEDLSNERKFIEEVINRENLILNKLKMPGFKEMFKEGADSTQLLLDQGFDFKDYYNMFYMGQPDDINQTGDKLKSPKIKLVKPAVFNYIKTSNTNDTRTANNNLSSEGHSNSNNSIGINAPQYGFSPYANFVPQSTNKNKKKPFPKDPKDSRINAQSIIDDSASEEEIIELEKLNAKKNVLKEIKERMEKRTAKITKVKTVGGDVKDSNPNKTKESEIALIEEKVIEDSVKGTMIKCLSCLQLMKYDNVFCYDNITKKYYILCNGSFTSLSILISDTFLEKSELVKEISDLDKINNNYFDEDLKDFDDFYNRMLNLLLLIQTKKPDMYWKYKNWNYYYNNLMEIIPLRKDVSFDNYSGEYPYQLLPLNNYQTNPKNIKTLLNKIEKSTEINEKILRDGLPTKLKDSLKVVQSSKNSRIDKKFKIGYLHKNEESQSWANWMNTSNYTFENKDEDSSQLNSFHIHLDNRRILFHCVDGELNSLEIIASKLEDSFFEGDFKKLRKILLFLYLWVENSNPALFLSKKEESNTLLQKTKLLLYSILEKSDEKCRNLVFSILIAGWEMMNNSFESQLECFYKFYSHYNLDKSITSISAFSYDLELNILKINSSYSASAFKILLQKLSMQESIYLSNNFNKVNLIKSYLITRRNSHDNKEVSKSLTKPHFISKSLIHSLNPRTVAFPFHWIILGYKLKLLKELKKSSIRSEEINPLELIEESSDEEVKSSLLKFIDTNNFEKSTPLSILREKFEKIESEKSHLDKYLSFKTQLIFSYDYEVMNAENYSKLSDSFWEFMTKEISINNDGSLLGFLSDLFTMCVGDVNEMNKINHSQKESQNNNNSNKSNVLDKNFLEFLKKNLNLLSKLLKMNAYINPNSLLNYAHNILNSIYAKLKQSPMKVLEELQEKFIDLVNLFSNFRSLRQNSDSVLEKIQSLSSTGNQTENEKCFEYNLGTEITQIYETIKFPGAHTIIVEIDLKMNKEKPYNYDVILVSEDHGYSNMKYNTNNNHNNYGTCFLMKLNTSFHKKLFLTGEEIKIISPSELEFNKNSSGIKKFYSKNSLNNNSIKSSSNKCILTIKCYPYQSMMFGYPKENESNVVSFINRNNLKSKDDLINWIELLKDLDYYHSFINKTFIKSVDNLAHSNKKDLDDPTLILKESIIKLGLNNYNNVINEILEFRENKVFFDSVLNYNLKLDKEYLKNEQFQYYIKNISCFPQKIAKDIQILLVQLVTNLEEKEISVDKIESNIISDFESSFIINLYKRIREITNEPNSYRNLKFVPSFDSKMKSIWKIVELAFILCLIYHLNLYEELYENDINKHAYRQSALELIGKKLNNLLTWMSGRVQIMKGTFDNLKNYLNDITEANNNYINNLKEIIIKTLQAKKEEEEQKKKNEDNKEKEKIKKDESYIKSNKSEVESASKFKLPSRDLNFKKKSNVKRLYQEIPKKRKKEEKSYQKGKTENSIKEDLIADKNEVEESFDEIKSKPFNYLYNKYPDLVNDFIRNDSYHNLKESIKRKIEADIKEDYFGNPEKLRSICEINNLPFNESNLQESLKTYTTYIFKLISNFYNFDSSKLPEEINGDKILKNLYSKSPYYKMSLFILERLFFLMELNSSEGKSSHTDLDLTKKHSDQLSLNKESSQNFKKFKDEDYILTPYQQQLVKSLFVFLYKTNDVNLTRSLIQKQYIKLRIREIGIKSSTKFLDLKEYENKINTKLSYKLFLNNIGSICFSVKKDLLNEIDCESGINLINFEDISKILDYYIETFNDNILLYRNGKGVKDFHILLPNNITESNLSDENLSAFHLKNLNLMLSDINILLKFINDRNNINFNHKILDNINLSQLENFILFSTNFIFNYSNNNNSHHSNKLNKLKVHFADNLKLILAKLISIGCVKNKNISGLVVENLFEALESLMRENKLDLINNVLDDLLFIAPYFNTTELEGNSYLIKLIHKLFELILHSDSYQTVSLASKICKLLLKNLNNKNKGLQALNENFFDSIYQKIGKLFLFKNIYSEHDLNLNSDNKKYFVVVHMNSPEIDYQFLVNALFYWEDKYPTKLSLYKYKEFNDITNDKEKANKKEQQILETNGISHNPNINANININNTGQKIKMFNYFNMLKSKTTKMNLLEKIVDERIANLKKAIEEANKYLASKTQNENKEPKTPTDTATIDSIVDRISKLKKQEAYQNRIRTHIKIAELIGETACTRGFVCLEPSMTKEMAEELAEVIHKAYNRMLPHFKANINERVNLFSEDLIYPKMPEKDNLLPGCTTTLKETTYSFMNVTLIEESIYEKINSAFKSFTDSVKKLSQTTAYEDKKSKIGIYNNPNFLFGVGYQTIARVNFNDSNIGRILENNCVSGISISMIIEDLVNLIHNTYDTDFKCEDLIKIIQNHIKNIQKSEWNTISTERKTKIIGLLIVIGGYYKVLRNNYKAVFKKNQEDVCKVLNGGHKTGKNNSYVIFLKEKSAKIEKISNENLEKYKQNLKVIQRISLKILIDALINSFEIYVEDKDNMINKLVVHLILKILNEKEIEYDEMIGLIENDRDNEYKTKVGKFLEILKIISNEVLWMEREENVWEKEFIDALERIYNRIDSNADLIYAPVFYSSLIAQENLSFYPLNPDVCDSSDLITKFQLPESNYVRQLPKITDFSKCNNALKNIQNFERYMVGEIFNYCQKHYSDDEYFNALHQIRNYFSKGDIVNAKLDLNTIFDNNRTTNFLWQPKEQYDLKEITKEECFPGNYYMAKLSSKFIRESGIKSIIKQGAIGINEIPVLLLLNDNTINQALVLYNDQECGKIYTFWIAIDNLMFLENQIKIPANSYKIDQLMKEFKYLEKRLRIFYSKNVLSNIMCCLASKRKLNNFEEILHYFSLSTWKTYRNNPTSGVFHNFKNYIKIKQASNNYAGNALPDIKSNNLTKINSFSNAASISVIDEIVKKVLSENNLDNLNSMDNKKLETSVEKILNDLNIDNLPANQILLDWCMEKWDIFEKNFIKIRTNLFKEYNVNFDQNLRNRNIFHIGNFSRKMLALHELCDFDKSNYAGIVLTFEKEAYLGPHAKISFYSDPYGENLIEEIVSIKTIKNNLESVVFNYPKVWMYYTPGTRIFYAYQWHQTSRDSELPCSIVFVPHTWSILISLTDVCTSGLFVDIKKSTLEIFKKLIQKLLVHCTALNFPAELQRRIFNLTNRVILKASKYLSLLEGQKKIRLSELSISQKFNILGIDEFVVTQLINNINIFNSNRNSEINFSSVYVVEGVEIIISILSVIKESFNSLDLYLKDTFDYSLPVWIEAVIKLGQFLNFFQGSSPLEGVLMKEIYDQLSINNQFDNIIIVQNIPEQIENSQIRRELKEILSNSNAKVVDVDKDIQILVEKCNSTKKTAVILIDGFFIDSLQEQVEEVKKEPEEEPLWLCFYCEMDNDKDNRSCVFCEKPKKIKAKEVKKEKPKSKLIKVDSYNNTVSLKMENLKNTIKNCERLCVYKIQENVNFIVPSFPFKNNSQEVVETDSKEVVNFKIKEMKNNLSIIQGHDLKNKGVDHILNRYLILRIKEYIKESDYLNEKIRHLENNNHLRKYIIKDIETLKSFINEEKSRRENSPEPEIKIDLLKIYETFQNNGVDLWLENVILDPQSRNNEINIKIMEKIRELVDLKICKEKNLSLILPSINLRFVPPEFNFVNHTSSSVFANYYNQLKNIPLSVIRFYWIIIKYFNNCLSAALPFIKPPDFYSNTNDNLKNDEEGYYNIPLPKTMSAFLSSARGTTFSFTKQNLIKDIIDSTEFNEEEVQIPTFKFERLNIKNQLEKNEKQSRIGGNNIYNSFNVRNNQFAIDEVEASNFRENRHEMKSEESMFLQAYEQAKEVDPAFFRSRKMPGDPLIAFKVNFKGENVEGIGGPYRQFFSDISAELQDKDYKTKKLLQILIPTSNNQADKGEYKDRWTINPSYNNNTALNQYEFFGILMGICIRTGVHLTLDLSSIIWKKITDESITAEDIFEFDEGLYRLIDHLSQNDITEESFNEKFNQNFVIELTDGILHELIPNGINQRVTFVDRFKFISLGLKARINEADIQIESIKKGLCKMIPNSLLKLLTYKELERLVCGEKTVDISLLKSYTKLAKDLSADTNRVKWLWEILGEISEEDKIKFVKFCWAQERLPSTHQEFQKLQVTFTIKSYIDKNKKDVFPRADTCFFSIELPDYSSKDVMKKLVLQAINLDNVGLNADKVGVENIQMNDYGGYRNSYYEEEDDEDMLD